MTDCSHCGSASHTAKRCTFGADPSERFLPCASTLPAWPCFWRRFVVPLRRADAHAFDPQQTRLGRADVGLRCTSAALFRSQGLRRNSQAALCFEASGHSLEISGALVRDLRPDEAALAERVRLGLDALLKEGMELPDPKEEPERWSASLLRGFEAHHRTTAKCLKAALKQAGGDAASDEAAPRRVAALFLAADGTPIAEACRELQKGPRLTGVVAVVGDDRGILDEEYLALMCLAERKGAEVLRVSLGGTTLLASHTIVILHHYLDEYLHRCEVAQGREYALSRKLDSGGADPGASSRRAGPAKRARCSDS